MFKYIFIYISICSHMVSSQSITTCIPCADRYRNKIYKHFTQWCPQSIVQGRVSSRFILTLHPYTIESDSNDYCIPCSSMTNPSEYEFICDWYLSRSCPSNRQQAPFVQTTPQFECDANVTESDLIVIHNGRCEKLFQQGPCPSNSWLVIGGNGSPHCAPRLCPQNTINFDSQCIHPLSASCPLNSELYFHRDGVARCTCTDHYAKGVTNGNCVLRHSQALCPSGWQVEKSADGAALCVPRLCPGDNQVWVDLSFDSSCSHFYSKSGCYEKSFVGYCWSRFLDDRGMAQCTDSLKFGVSFSGGSAGGFGGIGFGGGGVFTGQSIIACGQAQVRVNGGCRSTRTFRQAIIGAKYQATDGSSCSPTSTFDRRTNSCVELHSSFESIFGFK